MTTWTAVPLRADDGAGDVFAVQYCDLDEAAGWIREATARASAGTEASLARAGWDRQRQGVLDAWTAVGRVFQCLNVSPLTSPLVRATLLSWTGPCFGADRDLAMAGCAGPLETSTMSGYTAATRLEAAYYPRSGIRQRYWHIPARVSLYAGRCMGHLTGDVVDAYANPRGAADGPLYIEPSEGQPAEMRITWDTALYGGDVPDSLAMIAVPPLRWWLEIARELAAGLAQRGALGTLIMCRGYQLAANIAEASRLGLRLPELEAVNARIPEEAAALARDTSLYMSTLGRTYLTDIQRGTAIVGVAGPVGAAAAAVFNGVASSVCELVSCAVGYDSDDFGRAKPAFEPPTIDGDVTRPPRYQVPDPPSWTRPTYLVGPFFSVSGVNSPDPDEAAKAVRDSTGLTCARWTALDGAGKAAFVAKAGVYPAAVGAVVAALERLCPTPVADDDKKTEPQAAAPVPAPSEPTSPPAPADSSARAGWAKPAGAAALVLAILAAMSRRRR